jgi:hypothetical protein
MVVLWVIGESSLGNSHLGLGFFDDAVTVRYQAQNLLFVFKVWIVEYVAYMLRQNSSAVVADQSGTVIF